MELTQVQKELVIVSLGNSLDDPEQSHIHPEVEELYEILRHNWSENPYQHHSAKEIIDIREGR